MDYTVRVEREIKVTQQDIDDIITTAFEGGINYWCDRAHVMNGDNEHCASEQVSRGAAVILYDSEGDEKHVLTVGKFMRGLAKAIEGNNYSSYEWFNEDSIDTCNVDAEVADVIIQLALFGEVVYG